MEEYWSGRGCDPFTPRNQSCQLGNYVSYAANVSSARDAAVAVSFARQHNIRLVVRNTGHEYATCPF